MPREDFAPCGALEPDRTAAPQQEPSPHFGDSGQPLEPAQEEAVRSAGDGGQTMQSFMQEHLTSILHPIAQHVDELQVQVQTQQKDLATTDARVYGYLDTLSGLVRDVPVLQQASAQQAADLGDLRRDHVEAKGKHTALDQDHGKTKTSLCEVSSRLATTGVNVEGLQRALDKQNVRVQRLQRTLGESTDAVEGVYSASAEPRLADEAMENRQLGLAQGLQKIWELSQRTAASLDKLSQDFAGLQKEVSEIKRDFNHRSEVTEAKLEDTITEAQKQYDLLKATNSETKRNSSLIFEVQQYLNNEFAANQKKEADQKALQEKLTQTVSRLEDDVGELQNKVGSEAEKGSNLHSQVQSLSATTDKNIYDINKNGNDIKRLDRTTEGHRDRLTTVESRAGDLETGTQKLRDRSDRAENNIQMLTHTQNDHGEKLDLHKSKLEDGNYKAEQTIKELELTKTSVRNLHTVLGATNQTVSKHANRLDLAHEYITGLGKGVQETHRRVLTGHEGMLQPKGELNRTLPTIPTPRP